jgi:hypothetical protein
MALDAICSAVPTEMITSLATKETALEAWESIKTMRIGDDRIRKASAQKLRQEYEILDFRDVEGVEDFAMRLSGMVNQLAVLGDPEPDDKVVLKFLRIVRPRFKQLVISIETLLDVSTLSLEEVTGRLRSAEEDSGALPSSEGKLYLTEQEWVERSKKKEAEGSSSSGGGRGKGGGGGGRGRVRGRGRGDGSGGKGNCHRCGKPGHWARNCQTKNPKKGKEEQAFTTQEEEEESLLFVELQSMAAVEDGGSSGGDADPSGRDADLGGGDLEDVCAGGDIQAPIGAGVLEQEDGVVAKQPQ